MIRSTLMTLTLLLAMGVLLMITTQPTRVSAAADPTVTQCGKWLQNCAAAANAYYNGCLAAGGTESGCTAQAEAEFDTCLDGLYNAGCNEFPSNCYTIDVRLPYAKSCQTQP